MNLPDNTVANAKKALEGADTGSVLAREAGEPFELPLGTASGIDPIVEWLSLMEVVQMLCPTWPVRDKPMQGNYWRL